MRAVGDPAQEPVYTEDMQLRVARLCLDCEEVHDSPQCPICASESFAYLTRWVAVPERRQRPRPSTSPEAEVYGQLISGGARPTRSRRLLRTGLVGLTAVGLAGWLWRQRDSRAEPDQDDFQEP